MIERALRSLVLAVGVCQWGHDEGGGGPDEHL